MSHVVGGEARIDARAALSRRGFLTTVAAAGAASALPVAANAQTSGPGPAAQRGLKVLSAGSTLYGMRPAAEAFARSTGIPVAVASTCHILNGITDDHDGRGNGGLSNLRII